MKLIVFAVFAPALGFLLPPDQMMLFFMMCGIPSWFVFILMLVEIRKEMTR